MDRYQLTPVIRDEESLNLVFSSTYYPEIPKSPKDIYIFSRPGDRLDNLAYEYYQDPELWWIIALVNNIGHGAINVPAQIQLRIPDKSIKSTILGLLQRKQKEMGATKNVRRE